MVQENLSQRTGGILEQGIQRAGRKCIKCSIGRRKYCEWPGCGQIIIQFCSYYSCFEDGVNRAVYNNVDHSGGRGGKYYRIYYMHNPVVCNQVSYRYFRIVDKNTLFCNVNFYFFALQRGYHLLVRKIC